MLVLEVDFKSLEQLGLYVLPVFGSVMLAYPIFNLIHDLRKTESKRVSQRLTEKNGPEAESDKDRAAKESILRRQKGTGTAFGQLLSRMAIMPAIQRLLDQANLPWSATTVLINVIGIASAAYIACYFFQLEQWIALSISGSLLLLPFGAIVFKQRLRMNKFLNQLPDVFELMSQALRAGHSLANAIALIGQQLPDPAGTEFLRVFHEQNLGIKIEEALKEMAKRVGLMDVRFFVTAVLIQRQTGGDLAEVLDNISSVIRDRIKLFGTVKALTAEGRLSGYVLLALPIVVFVLELAINPTYANVMLDEKIGQYMLIGAAVSQVLGLCMIQKIVNIKV
jgi:tight adherence protein B